MKTASADGTWGGTPWESRSSPEFLDRPRRANRDIAAAGAFSRSATSTIGQPWQTTDDAAATARAARRRSAQRRNRAAARVDAAAARAARVRIRRRRSRGGSSKAAAPRRVRPTGGSGRQERQPFGRRQPLEWRHAGPGSASRSGTRHPSGSAGRSGSESRGGRRRSESLGRRFGEHGHERRHGAADQGGRSQAAGRGRDDRRERARGARSAVAASGPTPVDSRDEDTRDAAQPPIAGPTTSAAERSRRPSGAAHRRPASRSQGQVAARSTRKRPAHSGAGAAAGASAARPTSSRRSAGSPAATPAVPSARSWRRPTRSPTTASARRCASCVPSASSCPTRRACASSPGSCQYRVGNYAAAAKELEAYADLSDSVDQHPVLMDCYRAQQRWRKVDELWEELAAVSPSAELVTEGRIVYAGALADQGRLPEALALLRKRAERIKKPARAPPAPLVRARRPRGARRQPRPRPASSSTRSGAADPSFADVAERLACCARMSCHTPVVGSSPAPAPRFPVRPVPSGTRPPEEAMPSTSTKPSAAIADVHRGRRVARREPRRALRPVLGPRRGPGARVGHPPRHARGALPGRRRRRRARPRRSRSPSGTRRRGSRPSTPATDRGRGPDAPPLLPAPRRRGLAGRRRGRARSAGPATAAGSTPRCARRDRARSRRSGDASATRSVPDRRAPAVPRIPECGATPLGTIERATKSRHPTPNRAHTTR